MSNCAGTQAAPGAAAKPKQEPLSSWMSFEDPGQASATPAPTPAPALKVPSSAAVS